MFDILNSSGITAELVRQLIIPLIAAAISAGIAFVLGKAKSGKWKLPAWAVAAIEQIGGPERVEYYIGEAYEFTTLKNADKKRYVTRKLQQMYKDKTGADLPDRYASLIVEQTYVLMRERGLLK